MRSAIDVPGVCADACPELFEPLRISGARFRTLYVFLLTIRQP